MPVLFPLTWRGDAGHLLSKCQFTFSFYSLCLWGIRRSCRTLRTFPFLRLFPDVRFPCRLRTFFAVVGDPEGGKEVAEQGDCNHQVPGRVPAPWHSPCRWPEVALERHRMPSMSAVHHRQRSVQLHCRWSTSRCWIACMYRPSCIPLSISRVTREVAGSGPMRREFHERIAASLRQLRAAHSTEELEVVHVQFFGQRLQDGVDATFLLFRHRRFYGR
mmetsp:Transcript_3215/g.19942  ORF Transcript_3215/g.19942 Transcript_3215/m.19942 type:complete len:217 (+) Transcript_3215:2272-2922(+)